ncbi:SDR family NAD(P)-dependent oxidoreductase [Leifsonia poae]|uniref:SDR family NAD(P)-dependent oxidoreductase n=1 Tax=Leifsonia poae TaxID=110933 RepID=UPI003D67880A
MDDMTGQTVLVTGGTAGLGRATALGVSRLGARVGITGRDDARTRSAAVGISPRSDTTRA